MVLEYSLLSQQMEKRLLFLQEMFRSTHFKSMEQMDVK